MFNHYLITAFRTLKRNRVLSFINITGLSVSLAVLILMTYYINYYLSFENHLPNQKDIYNVVMDFTTNNVTKHYPVTHPRIGNPLKNEIPEIIERLRMCWGTFELKIDGKYYSSWENYYSDQEAIKMFNLKFLAGNKESALKEPYTIILTKSAAEKFYGTTDVLGKLMEIKGNPYKITGVAADLPEKTAKRFDFLISISSLDKSRKDWEKGGFYFQTFFELAKGADPKLVEKKINSKIEELGLSRQVYTLRLVNIKDITLNSIYHGGNKLEKIYIFSAISLLILILALINYANLTTVQATLRFKEITVRKTLGATRAKLIQQFVSESLLITFIAYTIALVLVELFEAEFKAITEISLIIKPSLLFYSFVLAMLIGIIAGIYPAFYLTSGKVIKLLNFKSSKEKYLLRKSLIVFQFAATVILIIISSTIYNQNKYLLNRNLGFSKESVYNVKAFFSEARSKKEQLYNELSKIDGFKYGSIASGVPNNIQLVGSVGFMDNWLNCNQLHADYDIVKTLGLKIINGRDFSKEFGSDLKEAVIINEKMAKIMNVENPVGRKLKIGGIETTIIGIVKDFNSLSLHQPGAPVIINLRETNGRYREFLINIDSHNAQKTVKAIKTAFAKVFPGREISGSFLSKEIEKQYKSEIITMKLLSYLTTLAIIIALLGLYGVISFTLENREKEINIRRVIGATWQNIFSLIFKEFSILVTMGIIVSLPVSYYLAENWLENYAFRINLSVFPFLYGAMTAFTLTLITVIFCVLRALNKEPARVLKYE